MLGSAMLRYACYALLCYAWYVLSCCVWMLYIYIYYATLSYMPCHAGFAGWLGWLEVISLISWCGKKTSVVQKIKCFPAAVSATTKNVADVCICQGYFAKRDLTIWSSVKNSRFGVQKSKAVWQGFYRHNKTYVRVVCFGVFETIVFWQLRLPRIKYRFASRLIKAV